MAESKKKLIVFHAWTIWLLSALFMFYKYALEVSPSVMTKTLMEEFHINGTLLGNLAASYFYAYMLLQIPAGVLLDRYGPRIVTAISILFAAVGTALFAESHTYTTAMIGRFLTGLGAAFAAVNSLKLIGNWFPQKQFAFMAGLMMTVAMLGAVIGQAPLAAFIEKMQWRPALNTIAVIGVILALVFYLIVRDVSPLRSHEKLLVSSKEKVWNYLKKMMKNRQAWWLSLYSGFAFAPVMVYGGLWGVAFTGDVYGLSHTFAAQMVSLIFIGFAVGAPILGWLSDWIGRRKNVIAWGTLGSFVCMTLVIYFPSFSSPILSVLLFFFGFFISSFLLSFTMIREISPPMFAGAAVGFMNTFDALFGAFSDPLTGYILDIFWDGTMVNGVHQFSNQTYMIAFITLPLYLLLSLVSLIPVAETHCKNSYPESLP